MRKHNNENQAFTINNITKNTNTPLEASPADQNMDILLHSQTMDSKLNETT